MTEQTQDYADLSRDQLLKRAEHLDVQGTGSNGYVTVDDLIAALKADSEPRTEATDDEAAAKAASEPDAGGSDDYQPSADEPDPTVDAVAGASYDIERQNGTTWWCPLDGHSMNQLVDKCAKCGATRDGDTVVAPDED